jgi:hypothetical protein
LLAVLKDTDFAQAPASHEPEKAPDTTLPPAPTPTPTTTGRPTPSGHRRKTTNSIDVRELTERARLIGVGSPDDGKSGETRRASSRFDVQQENDLASISHALHHLAHLKAKTKTAEEKIGPQKRVTDALEKAEKLLEIIKSNSLNILHAKIQTAVYYTGKIGTEIDNMLTREMKKPETGKHVVIIPPDSIQRTIGRIRTISEDFNLQNSVRLDTLAAASPAIAELKNMIEMAKKIGKGELSKTNDAAEELIGTIMEFGESDVDPEWIEFLLINAAGRLLPDGETDPVLETNERDAKKVTKITRELERFKLMSESTPTTPSEKRNLGRVVHFANALLARMDLATHLHKNPNSALERSFQKFIDYFEAAFREMPFISNPEEQTLRLMKEVEAAANAKLAEKSKKDAGENTGEETGEETGENTGEDTGENTGEDTGENTGEDTGEDAEDDNWLGL